MLPTFHPCSTKSGGRVHLRPVKSSRTTLCGVPAVSSVNMAGTQRTAVQVAKCRKCTASASAFTKASLERQLRGVCAYMAISDETTCFNSQCTKAPTECQCQDLSQYTDVEEAELHARAYDMPWPPPDIDLLSQGWPGTWDTKDELEYQLDHLR